MAKPNVLQQYIYNDSIQISPSDWILASSSGSTYPYEYYIEGIAVELTDSVGGFSKDNDYIILVKPLPKYTKAYLQYGILASEQIRDSYLGIRFRAKTLPSEKITIRYSVIIDTNTLI